MNGRILNMPQRFLDTIRKGIDEVDEAIAQLLEKRMDHVRMWRNTKEDRRHTGFVTERQVLDRILSQ